MQAFDPAWYRLQQPEAPADRDSALSHFQEIGAAIWCSPSPLFDVAYYLRQAGEEAFGAPFHHYVRHGLRAGFSPHPLIDLADYRARENLADEVEVLDHAAANSDASALNPLFQKDWYERLRRRAFDTAFAAFADFVVFGQRKGLSPFPLFDPDFFSRDIEDDRALAFDRYWARLPADEGDAFPFLDKAFLDACRRREGENKGDGQAPLTRLLDPFEFSTGRSDVALVSYLSDIWASGRQPVLRAGAATMARLLSPSVPPVRRPSDIWTPPAPLPGEVPADAGRRLNYRFAHDADSGVAEVVLFGADGLPADLLERLSRLAAQPGTGMVGVNPEAGVATGSTRESTVPRRHIFGVNISALNAVGGLDKMFVTPMVAATDLALRLNASGYGNLELAAKRTPAEPAAPDVLDIALLFDRHRHVLRTFQHAQHIGAGASL